MKLADVITKLGLEVVVGGEWTDREISGGYASDLLSDVIAHSQAGNLWITLQTHHNIIAVATLKEVAAIVLVNGRKPDDDTLAKAREEKVVLLSSRSSTFELAGKLYQLGIKGTL